MKVLFYTIDKYLDLHLLILSIFILVIINVFFFQFVYVANGIFISLPTELKTMFRYVALENINKICSRYFAIKNVFPYNLV
jgi:hypothetical protein